ncbi:hypothetical protein BH11BAC7_BH11BAC7_21090 [soil metagenome]
MKTFLLLLLLISGNFIIAQNATKDSVGPNETVRKNYYASGQLKSERRDKGSVYYWMGEGNPQIFCYYKNGKQVETTKIVPGYERSIFITSYYESGRVESRTTYYTDTSMVEKIIDTTWFESGKIQSAAVYYYRKYFVKNDRGYIEKCLSSSCIKFYESGICESKKIAENETIADTLYYESGGIKSISFTKINKDFVQTDYREDGTISKKITSVKEKMITEEYDTDGKLIAVPK